MGLDNGLILKTRKKIKENIIPEYVTIDLCKTLLYYEKEENGAYEYDICYWRKCWNIRSAFCRCCKDWHDNYYSDVTPKELEAFRDSLYKFLCSYDEFDDGGCIWSYDEMIPRIAQDIVNISWLIDYLKTDNKATVYFYDSY